MARGTSQSQTSTSASTSRPTTTLGAPPRGSAAATAGMRRRRTTSTSSSSNFSSGSSNNMLRFYTDEAPGLKISPTVVLVMSVCFIGFVTVLHVFGKFYRYKAAA